MAVNYAEQRNALYASAIINGYGVTDEQIYSYLTELKKNLKETITDKSQLKSFSTCCHAACLYILSG